MAEETQLRKAEHIKICLCKKPQARKATTGFEDISFVHKALPEIDKQEIDLGTHVLGHKFKAPIIVDAMTGGTPEARSINAAIAEAVEHLGLGMGVGSQRVAIQNPKLAETFAIARKNAPNAFLVANIGGVQLVNGYGLREVKQAIEMIDADAIAIHLNVVQEVVQLGGQTNFKNILANIRKIAEELNIPVVVKETGAGIAAEEAKKLEAANVKAINVGGLGGTSFAGVEFYRTDAQESSNQHLQAEAFWDWGIPTAASLVEVIQSVKVPVFASGGVRSGSDIAKALSLGASMVGIAQPVLESAAKGAAETEQLLSVFVEELKSIMFFVGAANIQQLMNVPIVIDGKTGTWLKIRGFKVNNYARRGTK